MAVKISFHSLSTGGKHSGSITKHILILCFVRETCQESDTWKTAGFKWPISFAWSPVARKKMYGRFVWPQKGGFAEILSLWRPWRGFIGYGHQRIFRSRSTSRLSFSLLKMSKFPIPPCFGISIPVKRGKQSVFIVRILLTPRRSHFVALCLTAVQMFLPSHLFLVSDWCDQPAGYRKNNLTL